MSKTLFNLVESNLKPLPMNRMLYLFFPFYQQDFNPFNVLHTLKTSIEWVDLNVIKNERIQKKGLFLHRKDGKYKSYFLITFDYENNYVIRKINGFGLVLIVKRTPDIYKLSEIIKNLC